MTFLRENQQLLPLTHGPMTEFDNFYAFEKHQPIIHHLKNLSPGEQIYLYGENGSGCSHLAKATCLFQKNVQSMYLPLVNLKFLNRSMLEGMNQLDLLCIEDIDQLANNKEQQLVLFDLINLCKSFSVSVILTSHIKPQNMASWLPDLKTRFQAMCNWQLPTLSDDEKSVVLIFWLKNQDIFLDVEVIHYIFKNNTRDLKATKSLLESFLKNCMKLKKTANIKSIREFLS